MEAGRECRKQAKRAVSATLPDPLKRHLREEVLRGTRQACGRQHPRKPLPALNSLAAQFPDVPVQFALVHAIPALAESVLKRRNVHVHAAHVNHYPMLLNVRVKQSVAKLRVGQHADSVGAPLVHRARSGAGAALRLPSGEDRCSWRSGRLPAQPCEMQWTVEVARGVLLAT